MIYEKLVPNLVVRDVDASIDFYREIVGFNLDLHVPDEPPFVFASMKAGEVEIFLNDHKLMEIPALKGKSGGALTLYIKVSGIEELYEKVCECGVKIVMPIKNQFYGMREFAFEDPDGWIIMPAEPVG